MANIGRPSKYTDDILDKAKAYIQGGYMDAGDAVPTVEGMAIELGITRATVYDWASQPEKAEFSDILDLCNATQARLLMSGALRNDLNANIAKLMLGKQGYSERSIQEHTGANGGAIKTENKWTVEIVEPEKK